MDPLANRGRPAKPSEDAAESTLRNKRARAKHKAAEGVTDLLVPIRRAAESQLKELGGRAKADSKIVFDASFQAEMAGATFVLFLTSTAETVDLTPPGSKPFGISKILDAYERLGGSEGAVTQIVNSYVIEVAE